MKRGLAITLAICAASWLAFLVEVSAADARPNILWLTSEDHGPHLGCYGDAYATTPNVDALAKRGLRYTHAWSNAPVCAPARTTLISGLYASSTGGEHMRSMVPFPAGKQMFPQLLREAGYYCTNNVKEDYNIETPGQPWDDSSRRGHWKHRRTEQPFFSVFNSGKSHESQIRRRPHQAIHDPAKVRLPAYHPDTREVREDWAQYYDVVSEADADAGERLKELDAAGLAADTIVFYFADHGSGMPRNKRWPCDQGLQRTTSNTTGSNSTVTTWSAVLAACMAVYPNPVAVSSTRPTIGLMVPTLARVSWWGLLSLIRCMEMPEISKVGALCVG